MTFTIARRVVNVALIVLGVLSIVGVMPLPKQIMALALGFWLGDAIGRGMQLEQCQRIADRAFGRKP